jgi:hypothetical protein
VFVLFSNHGHSANAESELGDVSSCYKGILQAKIRAWTRQVCKMVSN